MSEEVENVRNNCKDCLYFKDYGKFKDYKGYCRVCCSDLYFIVDICNDYISRRVVTNKYELR